MGWHGRIRPANVGPFQRHESPAPVRCLEQQFELALPTGAADDRERNSFERMLTGNRGHLGKILEAGSVACLPSACA